LETLNPREGANASVQPCISFIMPARNEERFIGQSIESIQTFCPPDMLSEIIVVDHGSTDHTREIASKMGAIVLQPEVSTIAALRNAGAKVARGNVYVFLDSDVTLTEEWASEARAAATRMLDDPPLLTGSNCDSPESDNWFLKHWFSEMSRDQSANSLGAAHMIVSRSLFERLHGFDERLRTGEDPDLCDRARAVGALVAARPSMRVIHHGYPMTVRAFVRRERWHGGGDAGGIKRVLQSKVMLMTLVFIGLHVALVVGLFVSWKLAVIAGVLLFAHLFVSVLVRFRTMRGAPTLKAMVIFYLYYFGRSMSFVHNRERGAR
jgi:glycosyltransferase involved in cell wall biosynthesis